MKKEEYIQKYGKEAYEKKSLKSREYYNKHKKQRNEYSKKYHEIHRDEILERKRKYRLEHHDEMIAKERKYSEEHKEEIQNQRLKNKKHIQEYNKKYYESNQVEFRKKTKEYYQKNKKTIRIHRKEKKYWQTPKGKVCAKKHDTKRKRQLGFCIIAKFKSYKILSPVDYHHIDDKNVIEVPRWLHRKYGDSKTNSHREKIKIAIQSFLNIDYYDIFNSNIFNDLIIDKEKEGK